MSAAISIFSFTKDSAKSPGGDSLFGQHPCAVRYDRGFMSTVPNYLGHKPDIPHDVNCLSHTWTQAMWLQRVRTGAE